MSSVGVVVLTRDRRDNVIHALERRSPDHDVVLVDNGSSDGTARQVRQRFPDVRVIEAGENLGAAGRNLGARALDSPFVAFSDDDSWWAPGALERAADTLERHPRLAILAARVLVGPDESVVLTCDEMAASPLPLRRDLPGRPVLGFVACGSVVRREPFLAVGGFERRYRVGGEEQLLSLDLAAAGWGLAYVPGVVAHHHPDLSDDRAGRSATELRNDLWSAWLRRPLPVALHSTLSGARRGLGDRSARVALCGALRELPWVLRNRRVVPAHVERNVRLLERAG